MSLTTSVTTHMRSLGNSFKPARCARRSLVCRVSSSSSSQETAAPPSADDKNALVKPEWMPAQAEPAIDFLNTTDFKLESWEPYKKYVQKYVDDPAFAQLVGWKPAVETLHGRLAMLGFIVGAPLEVFGAGSLLAQLGNGPQFAFLASVLLLVGSSVPLVKGVKGEYLESLRDTYTIPDGIFTEAFERVHGRLAMVGVSVILLVELVKGTALL